MKKKISIALLIIIVINMIMSTLGNSVVFAGVESTTTNTFESDGGEYSLDYILNQYNVFVKENYEGTHVVGPVITGGDFSNHLGGLTAPSPVDGYPHKVPSYIKGSANIGGNTINAYSNVNAYLGTVNKGKTFYLMSSISTQNPNGILFTDNYVDFSKWDYLVEQTNQISNNPDVKISFENNIPVSSDTSKVDVVKEWPGYVLNVQSGNVVLLESENLGNLAINVIGKASDDSTVIVSKGSQIQLPMTTINGKIPNSIEFEENGVGLVYSFPEATKVSGNKEITGHIVAPSADIKLDAGNYNGCLLAKSVQTKAEGHMWPYKGQSLVSEKIVIKGSKTWEDKNNQDGKRPAEITVNLLKNGTKVDSKKVTETDGWKWKFEGLDKYEQGKEITYSVTEEGVEGYSTEINGYDIKNTYTPGKTSVQVTKAWEDHNDQDGKRPNKVTIKLLADGKEMSGKTLVLTKENNWTGSFTDLDEYKDGKKIKYTVKEEAVGNEYNSVITGTADKGFVITNISSTPKIGNQTNNTGNLKTGDQTNIGLFTSLLVISVLGVVILVVFKKRKS